MKKFLLLTALSLIVFSASASYDSGVKKAIQVEQVNTYDFNAIQTPVVVFAAVLPCTIVVDIPALGSPVSNYIMVSEELTDVLKIRIRPPPVQGQKSIYTKRIGSSYKVN